MRVILSGGGTAGHINPALSIAGCIREHHRDADIRYIGSKNSMEEKLVKQAGLKIYTLRVKGFNRKKPWKNIETVKMLFRAVSDAKKILSEFRPDVVIGTGGYVSFPAIYAAYKLGIPSVIHEQNAYPGITNKMAAKYATKIMLTTEDSIKYLEKYKDKCVLTGLPILTEIMMAKKAEERAKLGFDERPLILSVGGSLGSRMFNEVMCEVLLDSAKTGKFQHVHVTGGYGWEWVPDYLENHGMQLDPRGSIRVIEFVKMAPYLAACDIIVSRCGASTLAEIQAQCKPSILVPSPRVAENHQYYNAMTLVNRGAARMIEEKDLTANRLIAELNELTSTPDILKEMSMAAGDMAILDANERIYKVIRSVVK